MAPSEVPRLTVSKVAAVLDDSDPADPHKGGVEVRSLDQLKALCGVDDD